MAAQYGNVGFHPAGEQQVRYLTTILCGIGNTTRKRFAGRVSVSRTLFFRLQFLFSLCRAFTFALQGEQTTWRRRRREVKPILPELRVTNAWFKSQVGNVILQQ